MICAASAGVHASLAPAHFHEAPVLGGGFVAAAIVLAAIAIGLDRRPGNRRLMQAASLVFGALLLGYVATRVATVPFLGGHREAVDALGGATKLIEALGLALAIKPTNERVVSARSVIATEKGVLS
jgi:hypothetical protein